MSRNNNVTRKSIPKETPRFKSKLATDTYSFIWDIADALNIAEKNTWEALQCKFKVGDFAFSVTLTSDTKYLYAVPTLVQPQEAAVKLELNIMVLNDADKIIHTPISGEHGYSGVANGKKPQEQKWEVLKFGEASFDYFTHLVYKGALRLYFEITIVHDLQQ